MPGPSQNGLEGNNQFPEKRDGERTLIAGPEAFDEIVELIITNVENHLTIKIRHGSQNLQRFLLGSHSFSTNMDDQDLQVQICVLEP